MSQYRIIFLGSKGVGKTSLLKTYFNTTRFPDSASPFHIYKDLATEDTRLSFFDCPDSEQTSKTLPELLKESAIVVLCFDMSESCLISNWEINKWLDKLKACDEKTRFILVGTKLDRLSKKAREEDIDYWRERSKKSKFIDFFPTSSKENLNISYFFNQIFSYFRKDSAFEPYHSLWEETAGDKLLKSRRILEDYAKDNSMTSLALSWHLGRKHTETISQMIVAIDKGSIATFSELLSALKNVPITNLKGSLAKRIEFIESKEADRLVLTKESPTSHSKMTPTSPKF